jgi:hypothetical protein
MKYLKKSYFSSIWNSFQFLQFFLTVVHCAITDVKIYQTPLQGSVNFDMLKEDPDYQAKALNAGIILLNVALLFLILLQILYYLRIFKRFG